MIKFLIFYIVGVATGMAVAVYLADKAMKDAEKNRRIEYNEDEDEEIKGN